MSRRRSLLLASALASALGASSAARPPGAPRAAGEIVFVSNRATANPGEIYALAPGAARRNLSHSPYADVALATSPKGRAFAFWSNRAGPWRLMISADGDGAAQRGRRRRRGRGGSARAAGVLGRRDAVLIPYLARDSITQRPEYAIAGVRAGPARRLTTPCGMTPALSPDGKRSHAWRPIGDMSRSSDLRGHVRFTVPGKAALWSADGRLAVARPRATAVLSADGSASRR